MLENSSAAHEQSESERSNRLRSHDLTRLVGDHGNRLGWIVPWTPESKAKLLGPSPSVVGREKNDNLLSPPALLEQSEAVDADEPVGAWSDHARQSDVGIGGIDVELEDGLTAIV